MTQDENDDARPRNDRGGPARRSRIPSRRLERLGRIGWMAAEAALGGLAEKGRRALAGAPTAAATSIFLTGPNAQRLARRLARMRGAAMKLGQLLSMEGEDFLPPEVAEALGILRAEADAMPESQLRRVLAEEWGEDWRARIRAFDFEPIAAASIGQVNRATALDGRELAVKIQYPGIAQSIESDIDNLAAALRLARLLPGELDLTHTLAEAKTQLRDEAEYRQEAEHLEQYWRLFAHDPEVRIPRVCDDLTTSRILAMDYLDGVPLEDLCSPRTPQPRRDRVGAVLYRILFRELFQVHFVQTDPNLANYLWMEKEERIGLIDLGAARAVPESLAQRYRRLFAAAVADDREALERAAFEIGFFESGEREDRVQTLLNLLLYACEPFRHRGAYDFARSDVPERLRALGVDLAVKKGFLRPPPPGTMFLHRKLGGTFLVCARLKARVDVRTLLEPHLPAAAA